MKPNRVIWTVVETDDLSVSLLADLEEFVTNHRPHGSLTEDATEPARNGYHLIVACPCGVVLGRWVTPGKLSWICCGRRG